MEIALREEGVPVRAELPEGFGAGAHQAAFTEASPRGEVPALVGGDLPVFDSTVALAYADDRWPEPPPLPRGAAAGRPHGRGAVRPAV